MGNDKLRIDVGAVIRDRLPRYRRFIPRALVRWLEKTVCQDRMNEMLDYADGKRGAQFCDAVLEKLNIKYTVHGKENLPENRRIAIVCNHPLGGLDGIAMIHFINSVYGEPIHFPVNDLLMAVKPLDSIFLPVNKHGAQSRSTGIAIDEAFKGPDPIIIFPAGLVSRKLKEGIADLKWNKMFVNKCISSKRDVIPVYFSGNNSRFFYNFAKLRERAGIKFNIEMIYLPREVFRCENASFDIYVGKPIPYTSLKGGTAAAGQAQEIRKIVYTLPEQYISAGDK
ncbi:MAG: 1-acyl-sn-glycerol-3-phosphate acyltransferase [Paramuribaculum sp.]|nr:1-acyl-sn-glycerol-3-phosphate acyltransferase [Paramuribaculum sp.]